MNYDRSSYINEPLDIEPELNILFSQTDPLVIFEIGACEGEDSIKYARLFNNSTVYAFEPLPDNIDLIKENIKRYDISNIQYFNKAVSVKEGVSEFYVSEGHPKEVEVTDWNFGNKSSSLLQPAKHLELVNFIHFNKKISVDTITIDSFCKSHNIHRIDFIHMDVQGAELMVLEGAGAYINAIKAIWLEVSKIDLYKNQPLAEDIKKFMTRNNFVLIKDSLKQLQGDQLYISTIFYPSFQSLFPPESLFVSLQKKIKIFVERVKNKIAP